VVLAIRGCPKGVKVIFAGSPKGLDVILISKGYSPSLEGRGQGIGKIIHRKIEVLFPPKIGGTKGVE
jgi:hypothetical protein